MLTALWSVKGGVGVSVTSAILAISLSQSGPCLLVDAVGDQPAILGVETPTGPTLAHWMDSPSDVGVDSLRRVEHTITDSLHLLMANDLGDAPTESGAIQFKPDRLRVAAHLLAQSGRSVVVDIGSACEQSGAMPLFAQAILDAADHSLLVTTPCYLALRRAQGHPTLPTGIVLVDQPERALRGSDVISALSVPIVCTVPYSAAIARTVDAGLLVSRLPSPARRAMKRYLTGSRS